MAELEFSTDEITGFPKVSWELQKLKTELKQQHKKEQSATISHYWQSYALNRPRKTK